VGGRRVRFDKDTKDLRDILLQLCLLVLGCHFSSIWKKISLHIDLLLHWGEFLKEGALSLSDLVSLRITSLGIAEEPHQIF